MKLAVSGKGGVGKTTVTALLARRLVEQGHKVLAIDADPNANLADALGFPDADRIVPIVEMKDVIAQRMGTSLPGGSSDAVAAYFKLNPKVDDLPARYCVEHDGLKLIVMGMVKRGGGGCACPENAFIKALTGHILLGPDEVVLMDMEAGLEHLGRGTAQAVDGLLVVVEPGQRSLDTLARIRKLASDLAIPRCWALANKVRSKEEGAFLLARAPVGGYLGWIPYSERIAGAGRGEASLQEVEPEIWQETDSVLNRLKNLIAESSSRG
jgi:CO dehydrogenase maturation factor